MVSEKYEFFRLKIEKCKQTFSSATFWDFVPAGRSGGLQADLLGVWGAEPPRKKHVAHECTKVYLHPAKSGSRWV